MAQQNSNGISNTSTNNNSKTEKAAKRKLDEDWKNWGDYMSKKQEKLLLQYEKGKEFERKQSDIFSNVCIFVNGYTEPPAAELRRLMQQHGGQYHQYETARTTHVIASNLCYSKFEQAKSSSSSAKITKPQWITDSLKEGRLLPETNYLLVPKDGGENDTMRKYLRNGEAIASNDDNEVASTSSKTAKPTTSANVSVPKAGDPNFVKDYYSRSRLHFIATWAQEMKNFVSEIKATTDPTSTMTGAEELKKYVRRDSSSSPAFLVVDHQQNWLEEINGHGDDGRVFVHLDMDCFFVSVGLRKRPDLRGQPVAVAHSTTGRPKRLATTTVTGSDTTAKATSNDEVEDIVGGSRSEIASCSYEARARGVRNGMMLGEARKLCPNIKTIPYDFDEYHQVSREFYKIVCSFTLEIEPVSCDEVYLDITSLCRDTGSSPLQAATFLRRTIYDRCQCPSSAGIGPNMLVARLATKRAKPNGQYQVTTDKVSDFMTNQKLADIPGVGYEGMRKLRALGVETCRELWSLSISTLRGQFGSKTADQLFNFSKGIDKRRLKGDHVRKSVSCDMNYGIRFEQKEEVHKFLQDFAGEVSNRLNGYNVKGRMIILKLLIRSPEAPIEPSKFLGCGACDAVTRSVTLASSTNERAAIAKECAALFDQIAPVITDLRGICVSMQKLEPSSSTTLSDGGSILRFMNKQTSAAVESSPPAVVVPQNAVAEIITVSPDLEIRSDSPAKQTEPVPPPPATVRRSETPFENTRFEETKALMLEWVTNGAEPFPADVEMVADYLVGLIEKLELEKVCKLLVVLSGSMTKNPREDPWRRAYDTIVGDVQSTIHRRYGCSLRIPNVP